MESLLSHFTIMDLTLLCTSAGISQVWHRFQQNQGAIENTDHWSIKLVARSFNLFIVIDFICMLTSLAFMAYLIYSIGWKETLILVSIVALLGNFLFRIIYNNVESIKAWIESLFFFIFWLRPLFLIIVVFHFLSRVA